MFNITNDLIIKCGKKESAKNTPQSPLGKGGYRGVFLMTNLDYLLNLMFIQKNGGPNAC